MSCMNLMDNNNNKNNKQEYTINGNNNNQFAKLRNDSYIADDDENCLSDSESLTEDSGYWNLQKMCDFENIILQPMKYDEIDSKRARKQSSKQFENCFFLPIPGDRPRRSSLPVNKDRLSPSLSPKLSPRNLLNYIKRELSSEDLRKRDHTKSPALTQSSSSSSSPKIIANNNKNEHANNNELFNDNSHASGGGIRTQYTPNRLEVPDQQEINDKNLLSINNNNNNSVKHKNSQPINDVENICLPQNNYFSKRRNTISTIAFQKFSSASMTGFVNDKKLDKSTESLTSFDLSEEAELFDAVENADIDAIKHKLELKPLLVNCHNDINLTPLDIAIMLNHAPMIRILLQNGARESKTFLTSEARYNRICEHLQELDCNLRTFNDVTSSSQNPTYQLMQYQKRIGRIEARIKSLKRMKQSYEQAGLPEPPANVLVSVGGIDNLIVTFEEPLRHNGAVVTKYKIEWSRDIKFDSIDGEANVIAIINKDFQINDLCTDTQYYIRVSCSNMKGFSTCKYSEPEFCIPNSWRDGESIRIKLEKKLCKLNELNNDMKKSKDEFELMIQNAKKDINSTKDELKKRSSKGLRKNILNLFMPSSSSNTPNTFLTTANNVTCNKFVKQLKKGSAYLAIVVYDNEKLILTQDDNLPIIEIDDNYKLNTIQSDIQFLIKLSMNWEDIRHLKNLIEKTVYTTNLHFRYQLLRVTCQMKNLLELSELGRVYHQPIKDSDGNVFFTLVKRMKNTSGGHNTKSTPIAKYLQKLTSNENKETISDIFAKHLKNIIEYDQNSDKKLNRGLYLAYLKVQSSIETVKVMSFNQKPNILPCCKIRDNPHISREEWQIVGEIFDKSKTNSFQFDPNKTQTYQAKCQNKFLEEIINTTKSLGSLLKIDDQQLNELRLYTNQVIEINGDVSLILVYPPVEQMCIIPDYVDDNVNSNSCVNLNNGNDIANKFLYLPVQTFEVNHLMSYDRAFIKTYSKLSVIFEIEYNAALQFQREAFSNEEINLTKQKLNLITKYQQKLEEIWKESRWIIDVINNARDRAKVTGVPLQYVYDYVENRKANTSFSQQMKVNLMPFNSNQSPFDHGLTIKEKNLPSITIPKPDINNNVHSSINNNNSNYILDQSNMSSGYHSDEITNQVYNVITRNNRNNPLNTQQHQHQQHQQHHQQQQQQQQVDQPYYSTTSYINLKQNPNIHKHHRKVNNIKVNVPPQHSMSSSSPSSSSSSITTSTHSNLFSNNDDNTTTANNNNSNNNNSNNRTSVSNTSSPKSIETMYKNSKIIPQIYFDSVSDDFINYGQKDDYFDYSQLTTNPSQSFQSLIAENKTLSVRLAIDPNLHLQTMVQCALKPDTTSSDIIQQVLKTISFISLSDKKLDTELRSFESNRNSTNAYCLVVILGSRERLLRDDYCISQLKEPWINGKFYIRLINDTFAALKFDKKWHDNSIQNSNVE